MLRNAAPKRAFRANAAAEVEEVGPTVGRTAAILDHLERISGRMQAARQSLLSGEAVDLAPVEQEIQGLCGEIGALPEAERQAFRRPLVGLIGELEELGGLLRKGLEEVGRQLGESGQRRQALAAYGRGGGPGKAGR